MKREREVLGGHKGRGAALSFKVIVAVCCYNAVEMKDPGQLLMEAGGQIIKLIKRAYIIESLFDLAQ